MIRHIPADHIVFLDETAWDRQTSQRKVARAVIGNRAYVEDHFDRGNRNPVYDQLVLVLVCLALYFYTQLYAQDFCHWH